jgi:hypothetical protein
MLFVARDPRQRESRLPAGFQIQRFSFVFGLKHNQKRKQPGFPSVMAGLVPAIHIFLL